MPRLFRRFFKHRQHRFEAPPQPPKEETQRPHRSEPTHYSDRQKFISFFGFEPELMAQERCKKEVLLKLSFFAVELQKVSEDMREYPHIYRDSYNRVSTEYLDALNVIGRFDPEFGKKIPHWTELLGFVDRWIRGEKIGKTQSTVHT